MNIIDKALELLGPNGENWLQGGPRSDDGRRMCVLEAVYTASGAHSQYYVHQTAAGAPKLFSYLSIRDKLDQIVLEQYPERVRVFPAANFNDDPRTTFPEVVAILEKARAEL